MGAVIGLGICATGVFDFETCKLDLEGSVEVSFLLIGFDSCDAALAWLADLTVDFFGIVPMIGDSEGVLVDTAFGRACFVTGALETCVCCAVTAAGLLPLTDFVTVGALDLGVADFGVVDLSITGLGAGVGFDTGGAVAVGAAETLVLVVVVIVADGVVDGGRLVETRLATGVDLLEFGVELLELEARKNPAPGLEFL
mmetsp:Transcript_26141/g.37158  ORF Transcript_26141/g.37158 Transcript_26141/m.37158 type:complete len:198 (-) Transcript_26141:18-611(-)